MRHDYKKNGVPLEPRFLLSCNHARFNPGVQR